MTVMLWFDFLSYAATRHDALTLPCLCRLLLDMMLWLSAVSVQVASRHDAVTLCHVCDRLLLDMILRLCHVCAGGWSRDERRWRQQDDGSREATHGYSSRGTSWHCSVWRLLLKRVHTSPLLDSDTPPHAFILWKVHGDRVTYMGWWTSSATGHFV